MSVPTDASAVTFQGVLRVVFVDQNGTISYIGCDNKADETANKYKTFSIGLDDGTGKKIFPKARQTDPRVASVAWKDPDDQVCLEQTKQR
jgi:hypothetical protein